jgi:hypothetical protein
LGKQPVTPDTARAAAAAVASDAADAAEAAEGNAGKPLLPKGEVTTSVIIVKLCLFLAFRMATQS